MANGDGQRYRSHAAAKGKSPAKRRAFAFLPATAGQFLELQPARKSGTFSPGEKMTAGWPRPASAMNRLI